MEGGMGYNIFERYGLRCGLVADINTFLFSIDGTKLGRFTFNGNYWGNAARRKKKDVGDMIGVPDEYIDGIEDACKCYEASLRQHLSKMLTKKYNIMIENIRDEVFEDAEHEYNLTYNKKLGEWVKECEDEDPPDVLKDVPNIKRAELESDCHVYFLLHKGEVVYVGQTSTPWPTRVLSHVRDKEFDDVWYFKTDPRSLNDEENKYISKYMPKYNNAIRMEV